MKIHDAVFVPGTRRGVILVAALWVMAFLALIVVSFVSSQEVELKVSASFADRVQARHLAASGLEHAKMELAMDETAHDGPFETWRRSPERFERVPMGDGFYSLIYNNVDDQSELAFGLDDENGKVNLNAAPRSVLKDLPGMTEALADCVIDWRDEDDEVSGDEGAESDYYLRLDPPYEAKNGPFDTVEELLAVKGFTPAILYGEDLNRNGVLDPNEDDGDETEPADDNDGELDGGLVDFVTVYSFEMNRSLDGEQRVNINEAEESELQQRLGEFLPAAKIRWIAEYRKAKIMGSEVFPDGKYATPANVVPLAPAPGVPGEPLTFEDYQRVADMLTVTSDEKIEGLINVNTARKAVLQVLPQLTDEEIDALIQEREAEEEVVQEEESRIASPTWIRAVLQGSEIETLAKYQTLEPFITVRSWQFTAQAVGVVPGRGVHVRLVAVLDRSSDPIRFLYWKDISGLGPAFKPPTREEWETEAGEGN
jgi:type II secretory pathway component PulK